MLSPGANRYTITMELGSTGVWRWDADMGLGTLSSAFPFSIATSSSLRTKAHVSVQKPQISRPISFHFASAQRCRHKAVIFAGNSRDPNGDGKEPSFMGEDGVIEDMDGYLNYLSLEYDSVWDTKPSWCQPWTVIITGLLLITISWLVLHSIVISAVVASVVCAWWYIFLYSYPKAYKEMIEERRQKVMNGTEDTFGTQKNL